MFQLNVLKANSGDSILIKYKNSNSEKNILIDGGVGEIYKKELKHIMKVLPQLDLIIITHIDRDHIGGVNKLLSSEDAKKVKKVCFNSAKLIRKDDSSFISISDGINLIEFLKKNNIEVIENAQTIGLKYIVDEMEIEFLSPTIESLKFLEKNWFKVEEQNRIEEEKAKQMSSSKEEEQRELNLIAKDKFKEKRYQDDISNWSSLAFEVKYENIKVFFLGDAKDSVIVKTLKDKGYSSEKKYKVDYVKLSHHGSKYNTSNDFLEIIDCNHFIFSTNGTHQKPHIETISRVLCHKERDMKEKKYLYFNYPKKQYESKKVRLLTKEEESKYNCECIYEKNIFEIGK